eukprot:TRINITY_DN113224_c0_g1_i1.p2 TRINITY_DN113224_c0_g1~~TRINITY_DN113224_c0_g1_i1.p2  ORF type:complete len:482 (+),score=284.97 TRINITY_DN113224_c0_g1_i1:25-1446(+)
MSTKKTTSLSAINGGKLAQVIEEMREALPVTDVRECLESLQVYLENLIKHPTDTRFYRINILNIHFQERMGRFTQCEQCMESIGFLRKEFEWVFVGFGEGAAAELQEQLEKSKQAKEQAKAKDEDGDAGGSGGGGGDDSESKSEADGKEDVALEVDEAEFKQKHSDAIGMLKECNALVTEVLKAVVGEFERLIRLPAEHKYRSVAGAGYESDQGRRDNMEDDEIIVDSFAGVEDQGYFAVYDGHGGRQTVDFVVRALHCNMEHLMKKHPYLPVPEAIKRCYLLTDGQLRRQNIIQSGTTSVTCIIRNENRDGEKRRVMYVGNVGDSRAVLSRGGDAHRLTVDHKPTLPEERKRIEANNGFIGRANRVNGMLAISRALGDHILKHNDIITAVPYQQTIELTENDDYLLLCCDGVWDVMSDQEAVDFVREAMENEKKERPDDPINERCRKVSRLLVDDALAKRSQDNITVMIIAL